MQTLNKKLYKSAENKVVMGVLGGFGEYFNIDPVILRVLYAGISIFTAVIPGIIAYLVAALLMPNNPNPVHHESHNDHHGHHDAGEGTHAH